MRILAFSMAQVALAALVAAGGENRLWWAELELEGPLGYL